MFWLKLALLLAVFQLPLGAIGYLAHKSGYLIDTPAQAQKREPEYRNHPKIGFAVKHGGLIGDVLWLSLAMAIIVVLYGEEWNLGLFLGVLVCSSLVGIPLLEQWRVESLEVPSVLGIGGHATIGTAIHYFYMTLAIAIFVMFACTPGVGLMPLWVIVGLLLLHVAVGVLEPIWVSTGKIPPKETWIIFVSAWGTVLAFGGVRTALHFWW
jgi:hypothetical protein